MASKERSTQKGFGQISGWLTAPTSTDYKLKEKQDLDIQVVYIAIALRIWVLIIDRRAQSR